MSLNLITDYNQALQAIYDHVGFVENWVVYPVDDCTEMFWTIEDDTVRYSPTIAELETQSDNHYSEGIFKQRLYRQNVYRGASFTLVFCDTQTDGQRLFRLFDNTKERTY